MDSGFHGLQHRSSYSGNAILLDFFGKVGDLRLARKLEHLWHGRAEYSIVQHLVFVVVCDRRRIDHGRDHDGNLCGLSSQAARPWRIRALVTRVSHCSLRFTQLSRLSACHDVVPNDACIS